MRRALQTLLSEVIDYAGLFPPAKLNVPDSVANYLRYFHGHEKWILGKFVCSTARLPELARELAQHPDEPFLPITVVGHASQDRKGWEHALTHDSMAMNKFMEEVETHGEIQGYEIRVPDHEHLESYIGDLKGFDDVKVFVELPWGASLTESLSLVAESEWLNAKARTGGTEAAAFPDSDSLSVFLQQCSDLDLPFKLTAGLHHPFPRMDSETGARMHGFLNVMSALALHHANNLTQREIAAILDCNEPGAFVFEEMAVSWNGMKAGADALSAVREVFLSYGSCSVDEPLQDMSELALL